MTFVVLMSVNHFNSFCSFLYFDNDFLISTVQFERGDNKIVYLYKQCFHYITNYHIKMRF